MATDAQPITTISATTRCCAVYEHPVKDSASPGMHNAALGRDGKYLPFDVLPENLAEAIRGAGAMKFMGLNLTVPHKLLAMDLISELDSSARMWGAVNTVLFEGRTGGTWRAMRDCNADEVEEVRATGFNTDADA